MDVMQRNWTARFGFALSVMTSLLAAPSSAQEITERSAEYRYQLDFHVPDAALARFLPAGWVADIAEAGNAKDANLRLIFIDRVTVRDAAGDPVGSGSELLVHLAIPVKEESGSKSGQMIIAGISDADTAVSGPFGVYERATTADMERSSTTMDGKVIVEENWSFASASGEQYQLHIRYERGPARIGGGDTTFYNPSDPSQSVVFRRDQGIDIARNVTTSPPDHVLDFSYSAGGGRIADLFDGTERALSWDSFPWYNLEIIAQ